MTRITNILTSLFLYTIFIVSNEAKLTSVIVTNKGQVRGEILNTILNSQEYAAFRGIPYAEPPVGDLRFKPPVEKESWSDVLNATSEGSMCTQFNSTSSSVVGSEDCLYLNVFTPHVEFNDSISKPVMVWIYGGAFRTGNSNASYYGPDFLLEEDVIVVSFNYRVSALGFLNLNHDNATGNCGLKDQNLALKWIQKNIANFGGNPNNITIIGQSAGSVSVDLHVLSDMSVGLFQQTISMSGSTLCLYWGFQSSSEAQEQAFILGSKLGTNTLDKDVLLETLNNAPAADIINAANDISLLPFRPSLESTSVAKEQDKFLTECSLKKYLTGDYTKGPHIMGFTSNETMSFAGSIDDLLKMVNSAFGSLNNESLISGNTLLSNIARSIENGASNLTQNALHQLIKETTDLMFITGIDSKQQLLRLHNDYPIYYYRFSVDSNYSLHAADGIDLEGTGHTDDLPYLFYMPRAQFPLDDPDIALTRSRLVRLWANFANYGNPTPNGGSDDILNIEWTDSTSDGEHLEIGGDLTMESRPIDTSVETLQRIGLGASPVLNECSKNLFTSTVNSLVSVITLLLQ